MGPMVVPTPNIKFEHAANFRYLVILTTYYRHTHAHTDTNADQFVKIMRFKRAKNDYFF